MFSECPKMMVLSLGNKDLQSEDLHSMLMCLHEYEGVFVSAGVQVYKHVCT